MTRLLRLGPLGIYRSHRNLVICIGPWCCHYALPWSPGRFGNGSRWRSGWYRPDQQPDY